MKPNGYIIHETDKVVIIATCLNRKSKNRKTHKMVQIYSLVKDLHPYEALVAGKDKAVCFKCPMRRYHETGNVTCYVKPHYLGNIWKAYKKGSYPKLTDYSVFTDRMVRYGSYGEPVLLPIPIVAQIASYAKGYTGYTHQWKRAEFQGYKAFFMASCTESDYQEAINMGWRAFIVTEKPIQIEGSIVCPASKEAGKVSSCEKCGLCSGKLGKGITNINIAKHS